MSEKLSLRPRGFTIRKPPRDAFPPLALVRPLIYEFPCKMCEAPATVAGAVKMIRSGVFTWAEVETFCAAHGPQHPYLTLRRLYPRWSWVKTTEPFRIRVRPRTRTEAEELVKRDGTAG